MDLKKIANKNKENADGAMLLLSTIMRKPDGRGWRLIHIRRLY